MESAPEEKLEAHEEERNSDCGSRPLGHRRWGCSIHSLAPHTRGFRPAERHARLGGSGCHADRSCAVFCYGEKLASMAVVLAVAVAV